MPRHTRRAGSKFVMSSSANRMRPAVGFEKAADQVEEGSLPGAVGPDTARNSPASTDIETFSTATRLPK